MFSGGLSSYSIMLMMIAHLQSEGLRAAHAVALAAAEGSRQTRRTPAGCWPASARRSGRRPPLSQHMAKQTWGRCCARSSTASASTSGGLHNRTRHAGLPPSCYIDKGHQHSEQHIYIETVQLRQAGCAAPPSA